MDPCGTSACSEKGGCQLKRRSTNLKCILQLFLDLDLCHMLSKHTTSLPLNVNECPAHTSRRPAACFSRSCVQYSFICFVPSASYTLVSSVPFVFSNRLRLFCSVLFFPLRCVLFVRYDPSVSSTFPLLPSTPSNLFRPFIPPALFHSGRFAGAIQRMLFWR